MMRTRKHRFQRREGIALLLSLVFIVLLTSLVVDFMYSAQVDASLAMSKDSRFQAFVAAKSAVAEGMALLEADLLQSVGGNETTPATQTGTNTATGANRTAQQRQTGNTTNNPNDPAGLYPPGEYDSYYDGVPWGGGAPMKPMNDAVMRTAISDEFGKINLNALLIVGDSGELEENEYLIQALRIFFQLRDPQLENDPVDAILDWLDYGDMDESRQEGAENEYYASLETPYPCKNGPMDSIEELLLIKGITPELYYGDPSMAQAGNKPGYQPKNTDSDQQSTRDTLSGDSTEKPPKKTSKQYDADESEEEEEILPLSEYLTVHGDWQGKVNANTAEYDVLLAVLSGYSETEPDAGYSPDMIADQIFEYQYNEQPITSSSELDRMFPRQRNPRGRRQTPQPVTPQPAGRSFGLQKQAASAATQTGGAATRGDGQADTDQTGAGTAAGVQSPRDLLRVDSYCFRIYGDGMFENTLVRVEAYVWRTPFDQNALQGGGTTDPFRILDWKVIQ